MSYSVLSRVHYLMHGGQSAIRVMLSTDLSLVQSGCHKCHTYVPGCWKWGSKFSSNLQRNGQNMREQIKPVKCCLRAKLRKQLADVKIQDIGVTFVTVDSQVTDQLTASR